MDKRHAGDRPVNSVKPEVPRRPYTAPRLIVHGTLADLTAAQGLSNTQVAS